MIYNHKLGDIHSKIYNKEELLNKAKEYTSFKEFRLTETKVYDRLKKLKMIDVATAHMKDRVLKRNEVEVKEIIKKYVTLGDLIKNDQSTYLFIKRNKLEHFISHLKSRFNK